MTESPYPESVESIDKVLSAFREYGGRVSLEGARSRIDTTAFAGPDELLEEVRRREAVIVGWLADRRPRKVLPPVARSSQTMRFAPGAAQAAWLDPKGSALSEQWLPVLWLLDGDLDVEAFRKSYARLLDLHDILRAALHGGAANPELVIASPAQGRLEILSLDHLPVAEAGLEIWRALRPLYEQPVSLNDGLVRLRLYRLRGRRHLLAGFVHHLAYDGRSSRVLIGELMGRYHGYAQGVQPPEDKGLQYADFVSWEASWLTPLERELADAAWAYRLASARPLHFPNGRASPAAPSRIAGVPFILSPAIVASAAAYARSHGVTLHMLVLAALALVLGQRAGHSSPVFGINVNGRPPGFDSVIGCFAQTRPFHASFEDDPTFEEFLRRVRAAALVASDLQRPISPDLAARVGFQNVLVNYNVRSQATSPRRHQQAGTPNGSLAEKGRYLLPSDLGDAAADRSESRLYSGGHSKGQLQDVGALKAGMTDLPKRLQTEIHRDLHFAIDQTAKGLSGRISYAGDVFDHAWISAVAKDLVTLLRSAMQFGQAPVSSLVTALRSA